jgi:hypothetical protein
VGLAIVAAALKAGCGVCLTSCALVIRQEVLIAQPEFNQCKHVELETALALAQLRQNPVGEHT